MTTPLLRRFYKPDAQEAATDPLSALPRPEVPAGVMICLSDPAIARPMTLLAAALKREGEPVYVVHLRPIERPGQYLRTDGRDDVAEPLAVVRATADELDLAYKPIEFSSSEPGKDLVALSKQVNVRMVMLGTHRTTFGSETLGGITGALLRDCTATVGIFCQRGLKSLRRVSIDVSGQHPAAVLAIGRQLEKNDQITMVPPDSQPRPDLRVASFAEVPKLPSNDRTSLLLLRDRNKLLQDDDAAPA